MSFIVPEFLYALGFLAIPILIHLFNFRRYKTVKFSQVKFLKDVKKQTQSVSRLKHLLVLLSRCFAITALVFAFAQPYIAEDKELDLGKKGVVIYVDNSFSMQVKGEASNLLDEAKTKALAIIDAYSETDRFQLHTNDFQGSQQRWLNKEGFINALQNVSYSPFFRTVNQVFSRLKIEDEKFIPHYYLISDFQKVNFQSTSVSDSTNYFFVPVRGVQKQNAFIQQLSSYNPYHLPLQNEQFDFTIAQSFAEEKSYSGSLLINSKLKTPFTVLVKKDTNQQQLTFSNPSDDFVLGEVNIKDFPVSFDDRIFFSYNKQEPIQVLHLYSNTPNKSIEALYKTDSIINYQSSSILQLDFSQLQQSSLLLLDNIETLSSGIQQALIEFVQNGGSIGIFPSLKMNKTSINQLLNSLNVGYYKGLKKDSLAVSTINNSAHLFDNVFEDIPKSINLPNTTSHWQIAVPTNSIQEEVLGLRNGDAFLTKHSVGEGQVYLSAVGLTRKQSNFQDHALFVPILFNMGLQSVNNHPIAYFLGEQKIELAINGVSESPLVLEKNGIEFIPKQEIKRNKAILFIDNTMQEAGHYQLKRDGLLLRHLSFNYNRKESDLDTYETEGLKEYASNTGLNITLFDAKDEFLSESIRNNSIGKTLWKYFVILALFFLGLEILFLRILK